jgi:hypothetical protein
VAFVVPVAVEALLTADVAAEIARTFGDQPVYPQRIVVDRPAGTLARVAGLLAPVPGLAGTGPCAV